MEIMDIAVILVRQSFKWESWKFEVRFRLHWRPLERMHFHWRGLKKCFFQIYLSGAYSGICPGGGLKFFFFPGGGAQHQLGSKKPLKSIDFTGPGGA